jgi:hypothetical protein
MLNMLIIALQATETVIIPDVVFLTSLMIFSYSILMFLTNILIIQYLNFKTNLLSFLMFIKRRNFSK